VLGSNRNGLHPCPTLRDETLLHFDAVYKRFDRLEIEYHALSAAVKRIE